MDIFHKVNKLSRVKGMIIRGVNNLILFFVTHSNHEINYKIYHSLPYLSFS